MSLVLLSPSKTKHEAGLTHCQDTGDTEACSTPSLGLPACQWKSWRSHFRCWCPHVTERGFPCCSVLSHFWSNLRWAKLLLCSGDISSGRCGEGYLKPFGGTGHQESSTGSCASLHMKTPPCSCSPRQCGSRLGCFSLSFPAMPIITRAAGHFPEIHSGFRKELRTFLPALSLKSKSCR